AAGRGLIRREPPSAFHGAERFTDTARPLPPISVAQRHGAGRAEIAERIGRAVDIADASAERRRVFLVERILDPDAEAMAPRGVEIVRAGEIDDGVSAVLDTSDPAHIVEDIADVQQRQA